MDQRDGEIQKVYGVSIMFDSEIYFVVEGVQHIVELLDRRFRTIPDPQNVIDVSGPELDVLMT